MFNYLAEAPDKTVLTSRSHDKAPFKVLAYGYGKWDSYASAPDRVGAVEALNYLKSRFTKSYTEWVIVEATAVDYATWSEVNA
jgi:hypothetical protein